jgi:hypothetical protein
MTAAYAITAFLNVTVLALTALQRLRAMGSRLGTNFGEGGGFVLAALIAIAVLTTALLVTSYIRIKRQRSSKSRLFAEYAQKTGLSQHESKILFAVARQAGIKQGEAIFTMADAFDRGAVKIVEQDSAKDVAEKGERLKAELSSLREKLGFQKKTPTAVGSPTKTRRLSSKQIPVGKKLHITRRKTRNLPDIEATVIKNDDMALVVKLETRVDTVRGELWRVRYYFGASVWEFDSSVVSFEGDVLVLNHSDEVRFINRRRFLRVPVNKPAYVARFPFARTMLNDDVTKAGFETGTRATGAGGSSLRLGSASLTTGRSGQVWGPPEFVPSVVTELAGPGLRIDVPLDVKTGERVLVVLKLDGQEGPDSASHKGGKATRIVEDIGEVRHVKPIENGFSIAVELTGLSDMDVNELIRATNAASLMTKAETTDASTSGGDQVKETGVTEFATT